MPKIIQTVRKVFKVEVEIETLDSACASASLIEAAVIQKLRDSPEWANTWRDLAVLRCYELCYDQTNGTAHCTEPAGHRGRHHNSYSGSGWGNDL